MVITTRMIHKIIRESQKSDTENKKTEFEQIESNLNDNSITEIQELGNDQKVISSHS